MENFAYAAYLAAPVIMTVVTVITAKRLAPQTREEHSARPAHA